MSINGVFRTSVSGMNAQANKLSSVSDNIANSSTTGYKRSDIEFSTLVLNNGGKDYQSGSVLTETRRAVSVQGSIMTTSSPTDLAIQGKGFFVVEDAAGGQYYTRAGAFVQRVDPETQSTYLVNTAGYRLTGGPIDANGAVGAPQLVDLPVGQIIAPNATTTVDLSTLQVPVSAGTGDSFNSSITVYDGLGTKRAINIVATKTAAGWDVDFQDKAGTSLGTASMTFGTDGVATAGTGDLTLSNFADRPGTEQVTIQFGNVSQWDADFSAQMQRNGNPPSAAKSFSVDERGVLSAVLNSGDSVDIYRLRMASFNSPDQLNAISGNVFTTTNASGVPQFGFASDNGFGGMRSGALEQSNVDLATELTTMIESQRAYSANSKSFQTGSEMLELLVNLKR